MGTDEEARRDKRAGLVMQVEYRNAGHLLVSYCTNLSRGGLFVPSADPPKPGTKLKLSLAIPSHDEPAELEAEVRWVRQFDAAEGPAGMGLSFKDIDQVLGGRIDSIVSDFHPLQIAILGDNVPVRTHVAAQVRSLLSCETSTYGCDVELATALEDVDLVVLDTDSAPEQAQLLLEALTNLKRPPPRLALCNPADTIRWNKALKRGRVLATPVEIGELRRNVLQTVTQVTAVRVGDEP